MQLEQWKQDSFISPHPHSQFLTSGATDAGGFFFLAESFYHRFTAKLFNLPETRVSGFFFMSLTSADRASHRPLGLLALLHCFAEVWFPATYKIFLADSPGPT